MSNPFKSIGKVFKKIGKVVKKIGLPVLAIGAAVLTGGAALGILPALGAGGLGLSPALASIVSSAGTGALIGGGTSLVTGGNVLKGLTTGGLVGAATGGIGQLLKGGAQAASAVSGAGSSSVTTPVTQAATGGANAAGDVINVVGKKAATSGIGSAISGGATAAASQLSQPITPVAQPQQPPPSQAVTTGGIGSTGQSAGIGSALGGLFKDNPFLLPGLLQGVGSGMSASADAKNQRLLEDERQERIAANYRGSGNVYQSDNPTYAPQPAKPRPIWRIDPISGDAYQTYEGVA